MISIAVRGCDLVVLLSRGQSQMVESSASELQLPAPQVEMVEGPPAPVPRAA
jgi:hypothetical protein